MKKQILLILCAIALALTSYAQPAPSLIPFQGRLTDQAGDPAADGQYTLVFNLYNSAIGGTPLWTERHEQVGVINSTINVFLGSISPFADDQDVDFSETLYLGITIDADGNSITADPEMIPRQVIVPAFYAKNAEKLAGADWSNILVGNSNDPSVAKIAADAIETDGISFDQIGTGAVRTDEIDTGAVQTDDIQDGTITSADLSVALKQSIAPPGTVIAYAGTTLLDLNGATPGREPIAGWLLCNGDNVSSGDYPELFAAISTVWGTGSGEFTDFNVPNLEARVLIGAGTGTDDNAVQKTITLGQSSGEFEHTLTESEMPSHNHPFDVGSGSANNNPIAGNQNNSTINVNNQSTKDTGGDQPHNNMQPSAGIHYLIKY